MAPPSLTATTLTSGRRGQLLAVALLLLTLAATWSGIAAPLLAWYAERAETLDQRRLLAERMARLAATLPDLTRAAAATPQGPAQAALLEGATDAIAAATLQQRLQDMAAQLGAPLLSTETVPPAAAGAYRRIALHLTLRAPWPALVHLLQRIEQASPRMLVDDLQLHSTRLAGSPPDQPLEAGFTVIAFRSGP